jgi:hypothetical protein
MGGVNIALGRLSFDHAVYGAENDRMARGLPAGHHVVALKRGHGQEHGQDERPEWAAGIDVLLHERQVSAERLDALHVIDCARNVAGEAVKPPARDPFGLAALDALYCCPQTKPI